MEIGLDSGKSQDSVEVSPSTPDRPPTAMLAMRPLIYSAPSETSGRSVRFISTNKSCNQQGCIPWGFDPGEELRWYSVYEQVGRRKLGL